MRLFLILALLVGRGIDVSAKEYVRSASVHRAFLKLSGYPDGRPGFVADHIFPLCAGGKDVVENLQWQAIADAKVKDAAEKRLCAQLRVLVSVFKLQWTRIPEPDLPK